MKPLNLSQPHLIILVGMPGSGKTFFAQHFADTFKAPLISLDTLRAALIKKSATSTTTPASIRLVVDYMLDEMLKTHQTLILDAYSDTHADRLDLARRARANGYVPLSIWVQIDVATARARTTKSVKNNVGLSADQFAKIIARFYPPTIGENSVVISGKHPYASQLKIVLKRLVVPRVKSTTIKIPPARPINSRPIAIR